MDKVESRRRRSIRLKGYNYAQEGAYFVTVCTHHGKCHFGEVKDDVVQLSKVGNMAKRNWNEIPSHFDNCRLDEFIVMPNHIHGIIILEHVGVQYIEPLLQQHDYQRIISKSIGSIIRSYKASVTRWCRSNEFESFRWQRNYYEHIIRDEAELNEIRQYIIFNPLKWSLDEENPENWNSKKMIVQTVSYYKILEKLVVRTLALQYSKFGRKHVFSKWSLPVQSVFETSLQL